VQEYLALEADSPTKHEFYRGELFAMALASIPHNVIAGNIAVRLHVAVRGKKCRPFGSNQRISIPKVGLYTYPDISVVCGPPEREE
jgi:Uma2 family endonuclease